MKSIRSIKHLDVVTEGQSIVLGVPLFDEFKKNALKYGFNPDFELGESVLPNTIGPTTRRNADGKIVIRKDLPKEKYTYTIEWPRKQWAGPDKTEEVTTFVDITRERAPREIVAMYNNYLTITEKSGEKYITSKSFKFEEGMHDEIVHTVNLVLEIFGECHIFNGDIEPFISPKVKRLDWNILPPGEMVWDKVHEYVKRAIKPSKRKKNVIAHRLSVLEKHGFEPIAVGSAGFNGYIVFQLKDTELFFFENPSINNATYVFNKTWEALTTMTKAEIIRGELHLDRIIHDKTWDEKVRKITKKHKK